MTSFRPAFRIRDQDLSDRSRGPLSLIASLFAFFLSRDALPTVLSALESPRVGRKEVTGATSPWR